MLDRHQARVDQVQAIEETSNLGPAAVALGLAGEPVVPLGRLGHLLRLDIRGHLRQSQVAPARDGGQQLADTGSKPDLMTCWPSRTSGRGWPVPDRAHDVSGMTSAELERARRDLKVSLALAFPGSLVRKPILAQLAAIDAEQDQRRMTAPEG